MESLCLGKYKEVFMLSSTPTTQPVDSTSFGDKIISNVRYLEEKAFEYNQY